MEFQGRDCYKNVLSVLEDEKFDALVRTNAMCLSRDDADARCDDGHGRMTGCVSEVVHLLTCAFYFVVRQTHARARVSGMDAQDMRCSVDKVAIQLFLYRKMQLNIELYADNTVSLLSFIPVMAFTISCKKDILYSYAM